MPGPAPLPAGQRRRRNAVAGQRILRDGYAGPVPELPGSDWAPFITRWWQQVWRSPMATVWAETETSAFDLAVCARMKQEALTGDTKAAAEARQIEDRYGLSPLARRKLGWELEADTVAGDVAAQPAEISEPAAPAVDPRRLRAIAGGAGGV